MRNIFFNAKKAKEEQETKARLEAEQREEKLYLEKCKEDKLFQKYIVEKRLKSTIANLSDIMSIPSLTAEQQEREVMARQSTVRTLKEIFNSIIN